MAGLVKKSQRKMKKILYADEENRIRKATSNDTNDPPERLLMAIAADSFDMVRYEKMYQMLLKRMRDEEYANHVLKALKVVEYLLKRGDERFISDIKGDYRAIDNLRHYTKRDDNGLDAGEEVRIKAVTIASLLENNESLNELRNTKGHEYSHDYNLRNPTSDTRRGSNLRKSVSERKNSTQRKNSRRKLKTKNTNFWMPRKPRKTKKKDESRVDLAFDFDDGPAGDEFDAEFSSDNELPSHERPIPRKKDDRTKSPKLKKPRKKNVAAKKKKPRSAVSSDNETGGTRRSRKKEVAPVSKDELVDFVLGDTTSSVPVNNTSYNESPYGQDSLADFAEPPQDEEINTEQFVVAGDGMHNHEDDGLEDAFPEPPPDFDDEVLVQPKPKLKPKPKPKAKEMTKSKPKITKAKSPQQERKTTNKTTKKKRSKTEERLEAFGVDKVQHDDGEVDLLTGDNFVDDDWMRSGAGVVALDDGDLTSDEESLTDDDGRHYVVDSIHEQKKEENLRSQTLFDDALFSSAAERDLLNLDDINATPKKLIVKKQKRREGPSLERLVEETINKKKNEQESVIYEQRQPKYQRPLTELENAHHQAARRKKKKKPVKLDAYGLPAAEELENGKPDTNPSDHTFTFALGL